MLWPPHDGVRRARRLNLFHDLAGHWPCRLETLNGITLPIVPADDPDFTLSGKKCSGRSFDLPFGYAANAAGSLPKRNSVASAHMRCRMTASLRATATRARAMPRRLATAMPQALRLDHFLERTSSVWAA